MYTHYRDLVSKHVLLLVPLLFSLWLFSLPGVFAHPGGRDAMGGHLQSSTGKYHFHQGPLKGYEFNSFDDASSAFAALQKSVPAETMTLGSFNIRVFSSKSRDDNELAKIVKLIKNFDLVAIQELRDTKVLDRTVAMLNQETQTEWAYDASAPVGEGVKERYGFLYRKDRVSVKKSGQLVNDSKNQFIREPYYATFQAGQFDFTLLTIHALYKSKNAPERKKEFNALAKVYQSILEQDPQEQDLILVGDFNDSPDNPRFTPLNTIPGITCLFQPPVKTTIKDVSLYDNILFQPAAVTEFTGEDGIMKFDETDFNKNYAAAKKDVSDHRPVWAVFRTNIDDDGN